MTFTIEINANTIEEAGIIVADGVERGDFQPIISVEDNGKMVDVDINSVEFTRSEK